MKVGVNSKGMEGHGFLVKEAKAGPPGWGSRKACGAERPGAGLPSGGGRVARGSLGWGFGRCSVPPEATGLEPTRVSGPGGGPGGDLGLAGVVVQTLRPPFRAGRGGVRERGRAWEEHAPLAPQVSAGPPSSPRLVHAVFWPFSECDMNLVGWAQHLKNE